MSELDPERQRKAREYARASRRLWLVNMLLNGGYALAWLIFGWGPAVKGWLISTWPVLADPWLLVAAFVFIFGGIFMLADLPLSYYGGFILAHRYGQSTQTLKGWISDQAKGLLLSAPLGLLLLELLYLALRAAGDTWWLWAAGGMLVFNVLLSHLAPILIMPLFNKYVPLGEEHADLASRLMQLAEKAGTRVKGVYKFDLSRRTKAANAALTGIGSTRRIILGDTMINEFTADEIETVLAHELGHHVHRDILVYITLGSIMTMVGLYAASAAMKWAASALGFAGASNPAGPPGTRCYSRRLRIADDANRKRHFALARRDGGSVRPLRHRQERGLRLGFRANGEPKPERGGSRGMGGVDVLFASTHGPKNRGRPGMEGTRTVSPDVI